MVEVDGNYRPDLKGLRLSHDLLGSGLLRDGNYRPDLKGLRLNAAIFGELNSLFDGNYRPDLKGLRRLRNSATSNHILCSDGNYRPDLKGLRP